MATRTDPHRAEAPSADLPLDTIIIGDCVDAMRALPESSVDLIFADPPYNLQLRQDLWRPNRTMVDAVRDSWDQFGGFEEYDAFTRAWLQAARRVLKPNGAIWVIGAYHNIYRVGAILQDLGFWILNDVVWVKSNPMPNFRGVRLANAHETLIWAARSSRSRHTFNHHAAKSFNDGKQLRSDWTIALCSGLERLRSEGRKLHSTQKPEALLERVLIVSTRPGDIVLDPFMGTGTTGAVAKRLGRRWLGIEQSPEYVAAALDRIAAVVVDPGRLAEAEAAETGRRVPRVPFRALVQGGLVAAGQTLYFGPDRRAVAVITAEGLLNCDGVEGSIHQVARHLQRGAPCNGWEHWFYETGDGRLRSIDDLRRVAAGSGGPPADAAGAGRSPAPPSRLKLEELE